MNVAKNLFFRFLNIKMIYVKFHYAAEINCSTNK